MYLSNKEIIKKASEMTDHRKICKCGHSIPMTERTEKTICSWCGNYVFRDKKTEFEYRLKEQCKIDKNEN